MKLTLGCLLVLLAIFTYVHSYPTFAQNYPTYAQHPAYAQNYPTYIHTHPHYRYTDHLEIPSQLPALSPQRGDPNLLQAYLDQSSDLHNLLDRPDNTLKRQLSSSLDDPSTEYHFPANWNRLLAYLKSSNGGQAVTQVGIRRIPGYQNFANQGINDSPVHLDFDDQRYKVDNEDSLGQNQSGFEDLQFQVDNENSLPSHDNSLPGRQGMLGDHQNTLQVQEDSDSQDQDTDPRKTLSDPPSNLRTSFNPALDPNQEEYKHMLLQVLGGPTRPHNSRSRPYFKLSPSKRYLGIELPDFIATSYSSVKTDNAHYLTKLHQLKQRMRNAGK